MTATTQAIGAAGERDAEQYLKHQGLILVERNYRCRSGEIDLIMLEPDPEDVDILVFIEVRLRGDGARTDGIDSVDRGKQRRLITTAKHYLLANPQWNEHPCRFDVVGLHPEKTTLAWVRHAFET